MTALLISEPPLVVLRSLAVRVGLNHAIVLQQMHYRQRVGEWVERRFEVWQAIDFPFWSEKTVRRTFTGLVEAGHIERRSAKTFEWRITPERHFKLLGQSVPDPGQSVLARDTQLKKEERKTPNKGSSQKAVIKPDDEPVGFGQWLGYHVTKAAGLGLSMSVPRAMTSYRSSLARTFKRLQDEGYSVEDFELASDGVLSDEYMRANGHVKPENVLRVEKIGGRIENGRLYRAAASDPAATKYADLFDGVS